MCKGFTAAVLTACVALAACDNASTRDLTAPTPGAVRLDAAALGAVGHYVVRPDGSVSSVPGTRASLNLLGGAASVAASGTTQCDQGLIEEGEDENGDPNGVFSPVGGLPPGTYDNIEVPPDKICVLEEVIVTNSVRAFVGSRLFIRFSQIGGNVEGLSARVVQVTEETTIGGDMDVRNAGDLVYPFASCVVHSSTIHGNVSCLDNNPGSPIIRGEFGPVTIDGNVTLAGNFIPGPAGPFGNVLLLLTTNIGGDADVTRNTGNGGKSVNGNTVANKLTCKKNDAPFVGGPNVANKAKGQCF